MKSERFWEIDALRGLAIVNMIIFNYSFALLYLGLSSVNLNIFYAYAIASTFIFLSGISMTLFYSQGRKNSARKFVARGLKIFFFGIIITIITYLAFPEAYVVFGILHFVGLSTILGYLFLKFNKMNVIIGILLIFLGAYLYSFRFDFSWALWLGFIPQNFYTFDYFPLLPWFGVTLLGISFGNELYRGGKRAFGIKDMSKNRIVRALSFLGRNSLTIYLLHQPVLILILLLFGFRIF
jgi:uncharacterized membrane protein